MAAYGKVEDRRQWTLAWRRFRRHRLGMVGGIGLILLCLMVLAVPWITPYEYAEPDLSANNEGPSLAHPMGTDFLGRDELTRVLYGGRVSLTLGLVVGVFAGVIGTAVGVVSGYYGKLLDTGFVGLTDLTFTLPLIPVILVAGTAFGFSPATITLSLTLLMWPTMTRLVRAQSLSLRGQEYVEAAKALGISDIKIILRHILPNVAGVVVVEATLITAAAVLTESALSYLSGIMCTIDPIGCLPPGIQSPVASWGRMIGESRNVFPTNWWLTVFPGIMIALTVLLTSFLGDGLRDALDPRDKG